MFSYKYALKGINCFKKRSTQCLLFDKGNNNFFNRTTFLSFFSIFFRFFFNDPFEPHHSAPKKTLRSSGVLEFCPAQRLKLSKSAPTSFTPQLPRVNKL